MTDEQQQTHAYQKMLDRIKETLEPEHLEQAFEHAKETAVQLGELTQEEAALIADYVKRDLHAAAVYIKDTGSELGQWLKFDVGLVEERLWDSFKQVADKTELDWLNLKYNLERGPVMKTGELTAMASIQCDVCGEILHFHKVSHIPPCPKCKGTEFLRV